MSTLAARNVALTDQILATLADESPLPISTMALWRKMSPPCDGWPHTECQDRHLDYAAVLRILNQLAKRGEVEKFRLEDMRCCYWRRF
jgi:hypothetical protein